MHLRVDLHHNIHTAKLRPHLNGHAQNDTLDYAGLDQGSKTSLGLLTLKAKSLLDLLVLSENLGVVDVTGAVKAGKNL